MKPYDLVVAGAGPAGLTLAWKAAEGSLRVLVFDKKRDSGHVAYTTSASFIDLKRWGLPDEVAHPISRIHFSSAGAVIELSVTACVLRRRRLLAELEKRCLGKGVDILYSTYAKNIDVRNESIKGVSLSDNSVIEGKVYADCSGLGKVFNRVLPVNTSPATKALGYEVIVPLKSEPHTVDLYLGGILHGGYGWIFPVSDEHAIVGVGILRSEDFRRIRELLDRFLKLPRTAERVENKPLESHAGVFSTGRPLARFHRGNLVIVGDVALQGNPAAGEGIRFVMDSAEMASRAISHAVESRDMLFLGEYSKAWADKYFRDFRANFKLQRVLYWLTGRNWLLDFLIRAGAKASDDTIVTLIKGEASPDFLIRKFPKLLYRPFIS
jgi:flavin-dependent dehydrogenase